MTEDASAVLTKFLHEQKEEIRDLRDGLKEKESEFEVIMNENEKHEKSETYMRGLMGNFTEIDQYHTEMITSFRSCIRHLKKNIIILFIMQMFVFGLLWLFPNDNIFLYALLSVSIFCVYIVFHQVIVIESINTDTEQKIINVKKANNIVDTLYDPDGSNMRLRHRNDGHTE